MKKIGRESGSEKNTGEIYSFDVFDTLVARQVSTPQAVWDILEDRIKDTPECQNMPSFLKESFSSLRQHVEILAKFRAGRLEQREDITLSEIYDVFRENYGFDKRIQGILCALERKIGGFGHDCG